MVRSMEQRELETMLTDIGVDVTRSTNKEIWAHCPLPQNHQRGDRNASWSINTDTGAHHCFSCGYRGSLRSLIEDLTGEVPRDLDVTIRRATNNRLLERALTKGQQQQPEVEQEIFVSEYQLAAYDKVPVWACEERNLDPDDVDFYGVRWDRENERYIIPIRSVDGKLLGWQAKGRKYFRNVPKNMKKAGSLFGLDVFMGKQAILVESPLDAVRLQTAGIAGGLASYGAWVSAEQMDYLIDVADTVVLALDHDSTGRQSMMQIIQEYSRRTKLKVVRYRPDDPKDVGEMQNGQIHRLLRRAAAVTPARRQRVHR